MGTHRFCDRCGKDKLDNKPIKLVENETTWYLETNKFGQDRRRVFPAESNDLSWPCDLCTICKLQLSIKFYENL